MDVPLPTSLIAYRLVARRLIEAAAAGLLAWPVAASAIATSFLHYRLAMAPGYDDVDYFVAAQTWLNALAGRGFLASLLGLINQHAPFSTALAAASFAAFGSYDWAPYVGNGVVVALCLFAFLRYLAADGVSLLMALLIALALATMPFFRILVVEFRPDIFDGLLTGFVIVMLFHGPVFQLTWRRQVLLGVLIGATLAVKPSTFPATGFIIACATLISIAAYMHDMKLKARAQLAAASRAVGMLFVGAVLLFGPYLAMQGREIVTYIYVTLFANAGLWTFDWSLWQQMTFYLGMLSSALGPWLWIGLASMALRAYLSIRESDQPWVVCGGYAALLVVYMVLWTTNLKTFFVGAMFYGTFIALLVRDWAWLARRAPTRLGAVPYPAAAAFAVCAAIGFAFAETTDVYPNYPPDYIAEVNDTTGAVWSAVSAAAAHKAKVTVLADVADPVRIQALQLLGERRGLNVTADPAYYVKSADEFMQHVANADVVVLSNAGTNATGADVSGLADRLMATHAFELLQIVGTGNPPFAGPTRIYGRINTH